MSFNPFLNSSSGSSGSGEAGKDGRGIISITFSSSDKGDVPNLSGAIDTYEILYTDNTESTINVYNGLDGTDGFSGDYNDLINKPIIPTVSNDLTDELKKHYDLAYSQSHTHSNKDVLDGITSNKITAWDGYSTDIQHLRNSAVGKKNIGCAEIFNDYTSNKAMGLYSHAEGYQTTAKGNYSHTQGKETISTADYQHVQGLYNVEDIDNKYAFIIGNGTSDTERSNAFAIDWNGKIYVNNVSDGVDVSSIYYNINELKSNFDDTCSAKTVYVDAANGSDTQDGSTQANALQTLEKALQHEQYAKKAVIYLAAGEYTIPDKTLNLLGQDVRIYGDAAATAIIKGNIVCENSFLLMRRVTIDSTDSTTANATADTITLQYRAAVRMVDCVVNTAGKNAVSLTEMSNANLVNTTFQGATQYAVFVTGLSDAKIYTCTDETAKGVRSGGGSVVYINNATGANFSYTNGSNGIVFVDGQQVLPKPGSIQLRHGKGTFTATATGTNVMWQYGGQQVQGSKCTFDVKSDNGLICMDFSNNITSLTISNDAALKLCLSDLGGRITDGLTLSNCSNITGDLSDLGGNITGGIALNGCPSITGDLSDLGGRIDRTILLTGCTAITGIYTGTAYPKTFTVSKTSITATDMDTNLINFATSGVKSGKFTASNMTRTAASDDAVATLVTNGWTVSGLKKEG